MQMIATNPTRSQEWPTLKFKVKQKSARLRRPVMSRDTWRTPRVTKRPDM